MPVPDGRLVLCHESPRPIPAAQICSTCPTYSSTWPQSQRKWRWDWWLLDLPQWTGKYGLKQAGERETEFHNKHLASCGHEVSDKGCQGSVTFMEIMFLRCKIWQEGKLIRLLLRFVSLVKWQLYFTNENLGWGDKRWFLLKKCSEFGGVA